MRPVTLIVEAVMFQTTISGKLIITFKGNRMENIYDKLKELTDSEVEVINLIIRKADNSIFKEISIDEF